MDMDLTIRRPGNSHYTVRGTTFDALSRAMDRHGCWGRYTFPFTFRVTGPADDITTVAVTVSPNIELPTWAEYRRADAALKREWDRMIAALERHEQEHHRLFTRKAEEFRNSVPNISQAMDRRAVDQLMADFRREAQAEMDSFDSRTNHGQRQGVELNDP